MYETTAANFAANKRQAVRASLERLRKREAELRRIERRDARADRELRDTVVQRAVVEGVLIGWPEGGEA